MNDVPIYVDAAVLEQAKQTASRHSDLIQEANEATDDARVIAAEAQAEHAAAMARLLNPED